MKHNPIANLVLIAVTIVFAALKITGTPYRICSDGAEFVHFLFGPATLHFRCVCGGSGTSSRAARFRPSAV
ncbi:LrgB family protein [Paraburkholderia sp. PGU19]|uniref:LrgB family protein n=1 Tax=Paraburkholderia sp. PGU19 TaxID=2735434 RepID=UPI001FB0B615|nr:LrgB family protein [Paraburkholderia sp. PGU19]